MSLHVSLTRDRIHGHRDWKLPMFMKQNDTEYRLKCNANNKR